MIVLTAESLSLSFGTKKVLSDVSFSLDETDRLGVIGVNGSGKSTLFKLILGELLADSGNVYISKEKSIGILKQDDAVDAFSADEQKMSAIEVMYNSFPHLLRMEKKLAELEEVLNFYEIVSFYWYFNTFRALCFQNICAIFGILGRIFSPKSPQEIIVKIGGKIYEKQIIK